MIEELINYLLFVASKHKAVNYTAYKRYDDINNQHNNPYYQFIIEDEALLEKQIVEGIQTIRLDIDILGFVDDKSLKVQDNCLHILLDVLAYIENMNSQIEIKDYSIASFSKFTDDNTSGIRASISFVVPSILNLCTFEDNFIDKPEPIIPDYDIKGEDGCTNTKYNEGDSIIDLNPLKLNIN